MSKKKKDRIGVVYSTNPDFSYETDDFITEETLPNEQQLLYVSLDRKQRKGKEVTIIEGFTGKAEDLKNLSKELKTICGAGGTTKEEMILIQGNFRDKIIEYLQKKNYKVKRKG